MAIEIRLPVLNVLRDHPGKSISPSEIKMLRSCLPYGGVKQIALRLELSYGVAWNSLKANNPDRQIMEVAIDLAETELRARLKKIEKLKADHKIGIVRSINE